MLYDVDIEASACVLSSRYAMLCYAMLIINLHIAAAAAEAATAAVVAAAADAARCGLRRTPPGDQK